MEEAQDAFLAELPDAGVEVVRRYNNFPQLALQVNAEALCVLIESQRVLDIQPDEPDQPSEGATR